MESGHRQGRFSGGKYKDSEWKPEAGLPKRIRLSESLPAGFAGLACLAAVVVLLAAAASAAATTAGTTTIAAVAATTTTTAARGAATFTFRSSFIHVECPAEMSTAVQSRDCRFRFIVVWHLDETESAGSTGFPVHQDTCPIYCSKLPEDLSKIIFCGVKA
jgi:hypothetical protein